MQPSIILVPDYDRAHGERIHAEVNRSIPHVKFGVIKTGRYSSSARFARIQDNVLNHEVFLVQRYVPKTVTIEGREYFVTARDSVTKDDACQMLDALNRAKAKRVWFCAPFIELRQDTQRDGRVAIGGKNYFDVIQASAGGKLAGIQTFELHCDQGTAFSGVSVDNFRSINCFFYYLKHYLFKDIFDRGLEQEKLGVIGADAGSAEDNKKIATKLGVPYIQIGKQRNTHTLEGGTAEIGSVHHAQSLEGRIALSFDDIGDTFSTMCNMAKLAKSLGAEAVYGLINHLFANPKKGTTAEHKIREAGLKVLTTDTLPLTEEYLRANKDWLIAQLSITPIIAEAIRRTINYDSVSDIFSQPQITDDLLVRVYRDPNYLAETAEL